MTKCSCTDLRKGDEFPVPADFENFKKILAASELVEVPVTLEDSVDHHPKWYRCPKCGRTWELTPPDYPYPGGWIELRLDLIK